MKNLFTLVILLCPALYGWADEENTAKKATDAHREYNIYAISGSCF